MLSDMVFHLAISTHAPAGGATVIARGFLVHDNFISTHAPAGGATADALPERVHALNFYSRPCGRGDFQLDHEFVVSGISTHAPAGGATPSPLTPRIRSRKFLLTPLREGRPDSPVLLRPGLYFYSRPCGRGDYKQPQRKVHRPDFYSRPCGRGDRQHSAFL